MAEKEKSCSECIHHEICYKIEHFGRDLESTSPCEQFLGKNDVAPVVRCKDCKCAQTNNFGVSSNIVLCCLETSKSVRQMDDFCSYGERKENDNAEIH